MSTHLARIHLLLAQRRLDLAERELRGALAVTPDAADLHALLALCLSDRDPHNAEALESARRSVFLAPDDPRSHYALATVLHLQDREPEAEGAIRVAIRLDPEDPDLFARLSAILTSRQQWTAALAAADEGLALAPEHVECSNLRSLCLTQLGRRDEAAATMRQTLARDPDDPVAHANMGWAQLHANEPRRALEHFREALRRDPNLEWARQGMVEALRGRYLVYRIMLMYFLWMSRLSNGVQWGVVIGLYLLMRVVRSVKQSNPEWAPVANVVLTLYLIFFALTWLAPPLFNLLLLLNRFGRYALSAAERRAAMVVGGLLLAGLLCLAAWPMTGHVTFALPGFYFLAMMLPVNAALAARRPRARWALGAYALALALLGPFTFVTLLLNPELGLQLTGVFVLAWVAFTWFGNGVTMRA